MRTLALTLGLLFLLAMPLRAQDAVRETRDVGAFTGFHLSLPASATVRQGDAAALDIEAPRDVLDQIEARVRGGQLVIEERERDFISRMFDATFDGDTPDIKVFITVTRDVDAMRVSGAGSIVGEGVIRARSMELGISGAGDFAMEVEVEGDLETGLSGAGELELSGSARRHEVRISGAGEMDAEDLVTEETRLRVSGAASCRVHTTEVLDVEVSGAASVRYRGNPATVNRRVSGAGSLRKID
jgi:hypothetical protein